MRRYEAIVTQASDGILWIPDVTVVQSHAILQWLTLGSLDCTV